MAELPEESKGKMAPSQVPGRDARPDAGATPREARVQDDFDPREEEGWTQPESSAQKGAERDEG
jgi:hypothetical protein